MAAALALLIILPVWASEGQKASEDLAVGVTANDSTADDPTVDADTEATRLGAVLYVSNQRDAHNRVVVQVQNADINELGTGPQGAANDLPVERAYVQVRAGRGSTKHIRLSDVTGTVNADFSVVSQETNARDQLSAAQETALAAAITTAISGLTDAAAIAAATAGAIEDAIEAAAAREIEANDGDTITITAGEDVVQVVVDGAPPVISAISPDDGLLQSARSVTFGFIVTDEASGLRTDKEDGDPNADVDGDGVTSEPLSVAGGGAVDITLTLDGRATESRGSENWTELDSNRSYSVDFTRAALSEGTHEWSISATDRAGNTFQTDAEDGNFDDNDVQIFDPFEFDVDNTGPSVTVAHAGIGFDFDEGDNGGEVKDSSSIMIVFEDEEALDPDTIEVGDFDVVGHDVIEAIHPNQRRSVDRGSILVDEAEVVQVGVPGDPNYVAPVDAVEADDDDTCESHTGFTEFAEDRLVGADQVVCLNTRVRVYLVLSGPLDDDETPEVQILGGAIRDLAGNGSTSYEEDASDKIAPTLTVNASGDVETTGRPLTTDEITVAVTSGERLKRAPQAWLVTLAADGTIDSVGTAQSLTSDGTNAWESDFDISSSNGVRAVIVQGEDRQGNITTTVGWEGDGARPVNGDDLTLADLDDAGLLVEFDSNIDKAEPEGVEISPDPDVDDSDLETESMNPFIKLTFTEGTENTIDGENRITQDDERTNFDAYDAVTITSITLDGDDASAGLAEIDDGEFNLSLLGLALGEHEIKYTAEDAAGNSVDGKFKFEVLARSAYEVSLRPGWNLVSVPANPADPAIDAVLPGDHPATQALAYQSGEWVSAIRDSETGGWIGTLTDIGAGYGYFILTNSFDPLETLIPEADPTTLLPIVPVVSGWNLLGVVDIDQVDQGEDDAQIDADTYLTSIDWTVAYGFDTTTGRWQKITTDSDNACGDAANLQPCMENGSGYWVWSETQGTLVP